MTGVHAVLDSDWFAQLAMYEADELDAVGAVFENDVTVQDWMRVWQRHPDDYATAPGWSCNYVVLNASRPPFNDALVRQALVWLPIVKRLPTRCIWVNSYRPQVDCCLLRCRATRRTSACPTILSRHASFWPKPAIRVAKDSPSLKFSYASGAPAWWIIWGNNGATILALRFLG